jgi:hypothetical protein
MQDAVNGSDDTAILVTEATLDLLEDKNWLVTVEHGEVYLGEKDSLPVYKVVGTRAMLECVEGWLDSGQNSAEVVEALYLYCRGFGLTTIARLKGVSQTDVRRWTEHAAKQFDAVSEMLSSEFGLSKNELQRLAKSLSQVPV